MTFKDLLSKYSWEEILPKLSSLYDITITTPNKFESIVHTLKNMPLGEFDDIYTIFMKQYIEDGETFYCISAKCKNDDTDMDYSMSISPRSDWLQYKISEDTLEKYDHLDILCHCLWDMTFFGFTDEEIKNNTSRW